MPQCNTPARCSRLRSSTHPYLQLTDLISHPTRCMGTAASCRTLRATMSATSSLPTPCSSKLSRGPSPSWTRGCSSPSAQQASPSTPQPCRVSMRPGPPWPCLVGAVLGYLTKHRRHLCLHYRSVSDCISTRRLSITPRSSVRLAEHLVAVVGHANTSKFFELTVEVVYTGMLCSATCPDQQTWNTAGSMT